ncbi:MAG: hypothetical protein ACFFC7_02625 [Candidatus Hermodarchaeota archaeon]
MNRKTFLMRKNLKMLYFGLFAMIMFVGAFSPLSEAQGYCVQSIQLITGTYISGSAKSTYAQDYSDYIARSTGWFYGRKIDVAFKFDWTPSSGRMYYRISSSLGGEYYTLDAKIVYSDGTSDLRGGVVLDDSLHYISVSLKEVHQIHIYNRYTKYNKVYFYFDYINLL